MKNKNLSFYIIGFLKFQNGNYNFLLKTTENPARYALVVPPDFKIDEFFDENFAAHLVLERGYKILNNPEGPIIEQDFKNVLNKISLKI